MRMCWPPSIPLVTSSVPEADQPATAMVVDASVLVDLLAGTELAERVRLALAGVVMHAPAHLDAEALGALGRLERAGLLADSAATAAVRDLAAAPVTRHPLPTLLESAWGRRQDLQLADALYVELADHLGLPLLTTDQRLGRRVPGAVCVS